MTTDDRPINYIATAVAGMALASILWLLLVSLGFGMMINVSHKEREKIDRYYQPGYASKQDSPPREIALAVVLFLSMLASLGLIITAFCFWPKHILAGKVLTIAAAVLFVPFLCCGVMLGSM